MVLSGCICLLTIGGNDPSPDAPLCMLAEGYWLFGKYDFDVCIFCGSSRVLVSEKASCFQRTWSALGFVLGLPAVRFNYFFEADWWQFTSSVLIS